MPFLPFDQWVKTLPKDFQSAVLKARKANGATMAQGTYDKIRDLAHKSLDYGYKPENTLRQLQEKGLTADAAKELVQQYANNPAFKVVTEDPQSVLPEFYSKDLDHKAQKEAELLNQIARRPAARVGLTAPALPAVMPQADFRGVYDRANKRIEIAKGLQSREMPVIAHELEHQEQDAQGLLSPSIGQALYDYQRNPPAFERVTARGDNLYGNVNVAYLPRKKTADPRYASYPDTTELIALDAQRLAQDKEALAKLNARDGSGFVVTRSGELAPTDIYPSSSIQQPDTIQRTLSPADLARPPRLLDKIRRPK